MNRSRLAFVFAASLALTSVSLHVGAAAAQAEADSKPNFLKGPTKAPLGKIAMVELPADCIFMDGKTYQAMRKARGDDVSGEEMGFIATTNEDWAVVFEFADVGFVKDDEKNDLNADKLLESYKKGAEQMNKSRAKSGRPPITVVGWDIPPKYDETTHNLEWAIRGDIGGSPIINYNTRLLGRKGVMKVILICEPEQLPKTLPAFRNLLASYTYKTGETYAEYRPGDKIAKYGLGALVVGGAAVGAAKLGAFAWLAVLFKKGFKLIIIALIAVAAFFKKLFGRASGGGN